MSLEVKQDIVSKQKVLPLLFSCAEKYKENLQGRNLLFICVDKHKRISSLEVSFDASNFLHMTGCDVPRGKISATDFFERCLDRRLSLNDFELADDGTTMLKLKVLPQMLSPNLAANSIGDFNNSRPKLYTEKLAGGVKGCIGFIKTQPADRYVPNTVLSEDIKNMITSSHRILATYRKKRDEQKYSELVYRAKKVEWDTISFPKEYSYLQKPE